MIWSSILIAVAFGGIESDGLMAVTEGESAAKGTGGACFSSDTEVSSASSGH